MTPPGATLAEEALYGEPNALAHHYSRFRVSQRLLLTGHSHQAWPDCGFGGQRRAWEDAARLVDAKWEEAFARADRVRAGYARLLGSAERPDDGDYALGGNTHELLIRFLSALPLVDDRTSAVLVSAVLFRDARIVPGLGHVAEACERTGTALLVDVYHALNAIPFDLSGLGLAQAFVVGGGYKYCQLGEGNCFLRVPPNCRLRPAVTGWFAEFSTLDQPGDGTRVRYGPGAERFAGSTYDPTSHYRAAEVFDFFRAQGLSPRFLRRVSRHQVARLAAGFDGLDVDPRLIDRDRVTPPEAVGGFLALRTPRASALHAALAERGVATDVRDDLLRLGPAPYLSDRQLDDAIAALGDAVHL